MTFFAGIGDMLTAMNNLSVPAGNLGVTRQHMPQIDDQEHFIVALYQHDIDITTEMVYVNQLRLAQSEINRTKVWKLMRHIRSILRKNKKPDPIFISQDNFVIDGSHRFVACLNIDRRMKIPVIRIDAKAIDVINLIREDPGLFRVKFRSYSDSE